MTARHRELLTQLFPIQDAYELIQQACDLAQEAQKRLPSIDGAWVDVASAAQQLDKARQRLLWRERDLDAILRETRGGGYLEITPDTEEEEN